MVERFADSGDPDQMPHSAASDLGLHCLPITLLGVSSLQWVSIAIVIYCSILIHIQCLMGLYFVTVVLPAYHHNFFIVCCFQLIYETVSVVFFFFCFVFPCLFHAEYWYLVHNFTTVNVLKFCTQSCLISGICKQCRPRSDWSWSGSTLFAFPLRIFWNNLLYIKKN